MVRHRDDPKFLGGDLIDDALRQATEKIAAPTATKNCSKHRISQNEVRRIEGRRVMQLGECEWNNNELHFNAART